MAQYEHLKFLPLLPENQRKKRIIKKGFSPYPFPQDRDKQEFLIENIESSNSIIHSYEDLKSKYKDKINPNLIFKLIINHKIDYNLFKQELNKMGINVLNITDNEKGYWIVFSDDESLYQFNSRLEKYSEGSYSFFNVIDSLEDINAEDKIGEFLKNKPIEKNESAYLNIELWRMEDEKIDRFLTQIQETFKEKEFKLLDSLITNSFVLIRVKLSLEVFKEILNFKEVAKIDRPFIKEFNPIQNKTIDINDIEVKVPEEDACGILIIDSGIISNHPLLQNAIKHEENFQDGEIETHDTVGHGTAVSGNCLYGDIDKCIDDKVFSASNYLFSAKIMYAEKMGNVIMNVSYSQDKLFENQFLDIVNSFLIKDEYKIKVVNISIGNTYEVWNGNLKKQFPLASLIDEISLRFPNVIFVVSAGNSDPLTYFDSLSDIIDNYPDYLYDNSDFKIINPATSSLSLTVGSLAPTPKILNRNDGDIWHPIANEKEPSPFTRTGEGINKAIKPELVEFGGNIICNEIAGNITVNIGSKLTVLSNEISSELFRFDSGTSFSAPKISNTIGKVGNHFLNSSSNFIKNIILQSANDKFDLNFKGSETEIKKKKLFTIGYGLPNYEDAVFSTNNKVVLYDENEIGLDKVLCYSLNLPEIFNNTNGNKRISIVLTFNPITRATRGDSYFGNVMEFRLFNGIESDIVLKNNSVIENIDDETEEIISSTSALKLEPTSNVRSCTCHQKGTKTFPRKKILNPLTLILFNKNKWITDENYKQKFCISLMIEHEAEIDLYSEIRNEVQVRTRIR
ncbi:MAG TPA: S8 family peptidase [Ignavibacteria bacterium]|nr:S8 family peptidase [Ignavibacteria bacterium]